jgi:hypothetical protein
LKQFLRKLAADKDREPSPVFLIGGIIGAVGGLVGGFATSLYEELFY